MPTNRCDEIVRLIDEALADCEHTTAAAPPRPCRQQAGHGPHGRELEVFRRDDGPAMRPRTREPVAIEGQWS
jgi:hypothetical protein